MRYFLHPNVCNRVTLAQATPQVRRDPVFEVTEAKSISPRTMPVVSGWSSPWGSCGLDEWLVEPISLLNSAQKPQKVLPRAEQTLIGDRDTGSAQGTFMFLFSTRSPAHCRGEGFNQGTKQRTGLRGRKKKS